MVNKQSKADIAKALRQPVYPLLTQRKEGFGHFVYWYKKISVAPKKPREKVCLYVTEAQRGTAPTTPLKKHAHAHTAPAMKDFHLPPT